VVMDWNEFDPGIQALQSGVLRDLNEELHEMTDHNDIHHPAAVAAGLSGGNPVTYDAARLNGRPVEPCADASAADEGVRISGVSTEASSKSADARKARGTSFLIGRKPAIRVLAAGSKYASGSARRGYDYVWWNLFDALNRFENIEAHFYDCAAEARRSGIEAMCGQLGNIVLKEKPDILFYGGSSDGFAEFVRSCLKRITGSTDTQTVLWMNDQEERQGGGLALSEACADLIVTLSPDSAQRYAAAGFGRKIMMSQWGFNPFTYALPFSPRSRGISFCGTAKGDRSEIIRKMRQHGLAVGTFGPDWQEDLTLPLADMVRIFRQSRINLNLNDIGDFAARQIKKRTFEVPGCRGFLLTIPAGHLDAYYEPGREVAVASSLEELIDKCRYYLVHDKEREEIARRGYERTLAEHTWSHRLKDMFECLGFAAIPGESAPAGTRNPYPGVSDFPGGEEAASPGCSDPRGCTEESVTPEEREIETSIIVLAFNKLEYTRQCVESILHYTNGSYELLLVDNGSADGTFEYFERVKDFHPDTRVIRHFQNRVVEEIGIHVFSLARGKYIACVANDAIVHEGWLENFIRQMESAPDIAMVGPRSNNVSGPQMMPTEYDTVEAFHAFADEWCRRHKGSNFVIHRVVGVANILKKSVLERIGGFDPDLPTNGREGGYGFSDDDFSLRLTLAGYRMLVANDVFIHHFGSVTTRQDRPDLFGAPQNVNKEKYRRKLQQNDRVSVGADGVIKVRPYRLDEEIPVDERTAIRTPRVCFVEKGRGGKKSRAEYGYAALARKYNGDIIPGRGETISALILKALEKNEFDFLVLIDSRLAPSPEILSALTEYALCYPDVAVMVPTGNYGALTHAHKPDSAPEVERIPYADLSLCVINLNVVRPLRMALARCENEEEWPWFFQRRIRGESYFIAKANSLEVNGDWTRYAHPYDALRLPEQLLDEKKYAEAGAIYRDDLSRDPDFAEACYQLASIAVKQRRLEEAIDHARRALQADPHHIPSLVLLSGIFLEQGDFQNAADTVSQANFKQPGNPEVKKIVSRYEEQFKRHPEAFQENPDGAATFPTRRETVKGSVSIVIVTRNRLDFTKKCVNSIRRHTRRPYEIVFVDNDSKDSTMKWLKRQVKENKDCRLIENRENVGLIKGRNQGINAAQGEYIVLLDQDALVSRGWLDSMLQCLNRCSAAGIVGPMTNRGGGIQQVLDDSYRSVDFLDKYAAKFMERYRHRRIPCRCVAGFCLLFKRSVVEKIGLFDETFESGHFEDEDYCLRAALADYRNYIAGDVFVHRLEGGKSHGDRQILNKKWELGPASPEGKKLAVLKATELAGDLYQKGKMGQAVDTLINCIKLIPDSKEVYFELVRLFMESGQFSEAWDVVGTMPEAVKNDLKGLQYAGYTQEGLGLDGEAAGYAERILLQNGSCPEALNLKGVLAYKSGAKEEAVDYFREAVEVDPGYGEASTNLGVLLWGIDEKEEGLACLRRGFMLSPTVPDSSSLYYSAISSLGLFRNAEAEFREAVSLYPQNKNLAFLYIDILLQLGKLKEALLKIEDALALFGIDEGVLNAAMAVRDKIGPSKIENPSKKSTLSLCMIVKNEEKHLAACLRSVRDIVDEMIVVDTGSTDRTMEIARVFGAKVFEVPWTGDFSAARNASLAQATGDWIFVLDADEVLSPRDFKELRTLIETPSSSPAAYLITTRNYVEKFGIIGWTANDGQYPEEMGAGWIPSAKVRLFKRRSNIRFSNPVHELVEYSLHQAKIPILRSSIVVHHYGKLDTEREGMKSREYYLLGRMKYERDPKNMKYVYELAKQAQLLKKYDEAARLWLELLDLLRENPESAGYKTIAAISCGDPLPEIYIQLASAYIMLDRCDEALELARKAMKESRIKLPAYVNVYAYCEMIAGSLNAASSALEELLRDMPDYPPALSLMAVIHCLEDKEEQARELSRQLRLKGIPLSATLKHISEKLSSYGKKDEAELILKWMAGASGSYCKNSHGLEAAQINGS